MADDPYREVQIPSSDGMNKLHVCIWEAEHPRAVLQVVHGMAEHITRYAEFAEYLKARGITVVGDDHLGHGGTARKGDKGYFAKDDPAGHLVADENLVRDYIRQNYDGVPCFLLGHSMGSFIARNLICESGDAYQGAIIMGTGMTPKGLLKFSIGLAKFQSRLFGDHHPAALINMLAFGSYTKRIENAETPFDWLSANRENIDRYMSDPDSGFLFTANGFLGLFDLILRLHDEKRLSGMPADLPVLFISGAEDPVGSYGEAVKAVEESFRTRYGMRHTELRLLPGQRHEILNEDARQETYESLAAWIEDKI